MATYLVTGGAGFIGSALVRQLIAETGDSVVTLDRLTYAGDLERLAAVRGNPQHHFVQADICDARAVREVLATHRPAAVFHLAAESHVDRSIDAPADFIQSNIVGTFTLLEAALGYWRDLPAESREAFRFIHVSTDEVFGSLGAAGRFTPATRYDPSSPYAASKAAADHLARAWHRTWGLPVIVTNSGNSFGPFQYPEKLIPLAITKALAGQPVPVYGRGDNIRDWLFVGDHVRALRRIAQAGTVGATYLVSAGNERRNIDVVRQLCAVLDELHPAANGSYERLITFVADRPGHDFRYAGDAALLRDTLGWVPAADFTDALRETVRWYLGAGDWIRDVMAAGYRGERLGMRGQQRDV